jgi:hypothetical protein
VLIDHGVNAFPEMMQIHKTSPTRARGINKDSFHAPTFFLPLVTGTPPDDEELRVLLLGILISGCQRVCTHKNRREMMALRALNTAVWPLYRSAGGDFNSVARSRTE